MREHILALLSVLALVGDVVLVLAGHDVPPFLEAVTIATVSAAAGAQVPRSSTSSSLPRGL